MRNIGKHKMFLNSLGNIFASLEAKFCFRNNVSTGGQTGKHLRKHRESQMFPQQCFLVCSGLNCVIRTKLERTVVFGRVKRKTSCSLDIAGIKRRPAPKPTFEQFNSLTFYNLLR